MSGYRIAIVAVVVSLVASPDLRADDKATLSVSGHGKLSAAPDVAEINVGVLTHGPTAREALSANNEAMTALLVVLKDQGVAAKDVQTTTISISPQYAEPPAAGPGAVAGRPNESVPKIVGYQVINTVRVTARDLAKLGQVLDAIVQAGANQMYGITFRIDQPEKLLDQARKGAVADAARKARLLADEAGVVLGPPIRIREGGAVPPRPMMAPGMAMMMGTATVPIASGDQELSVTLEVVFGIKPAH